MRERESHKEDELFIITTKSLLQFWLCIKAESTGANSKMKRERKKEKEMWEKILCGWLEVDAIFISLCQLS